MRVVSHPSMFVHRGWFMYRGGGIMESGDRERARTRTRTTIPLTGFIFR